MKIEMIKHTGGVKAFLSGFSTQDLHVKIEACKIGECVCECDPEIMQKIKSIELAEVEGGSTITIEGDIDAQTLAPMMQECLMTQKR